LATGSSNIDIGHSGSAGEAGTIRIGTPSFQTRAFVSGVYGITPGGGTTQPVVIDQYGQLGTTTSSRRFKQDIRDLGDTTSAVMSLRPVRFRYKVHGPDGPEQYGLVAEEVQEVDPELVVRDLDGQVNSVSYDKVNIMLLNEVQRQHRLIETQRETIESQKSGFADRIQQLENRLVELENRAQ